jgi:glycosyltransferase involved in cell wall biosynthesis
LKNALVPEVNQIQVLTEELRRLRHGVDKLYWATSYFVGRHSFMHSALARTALVITPSRHTKARYVGFGLPEATIEPIYHGLRTDLFKATPKTASDRLRFAYFGGLMSHKGVEFLLKAFAGIPREKASLLIFGVPANDDYEAYLHKLAGASAVMWHEHYDNAAMPGILADVDVVIVPSLWEETFNLIVREAFLTKTPVIAARTGALEEAIEDGVNGYLVEPGNVAELREKIEMLVAHPETVSQLSRGIRPVKDISEQTSEIETIYSEIIANHRRASKKPTAQ